jgi:hypothetical protein
MATGSPSYLNYIYFIDMSHVAGIMLSKKTGRGLSLIKLSGVLADNEIKVTV